MVIIATDLAQGHPDRPLANAHTTANGCLALVRGCALLAFTLGASAILGWAFNITLLKSGLPGLTATQPLVALCLMLCGAALAAAGLNALRARAIVLTCATLVLTIVSIILIQNALDADWGSDRWLFPDAVTHEQTGPHLRSGRPPGAALIAFALIGLCLLMISAARVRMARTYVAFTALGAMGAVCLLLAYAFNVRALYVMGLYAQVGPLTGIGLGSLFVGLLALRPDLAPTKYILGNSLGAVTTRRLLTWTVAVLIVLAGIVQFGTRASWYRAELEIALVTLAGIGVLFAGLISHARRIDALEKTRRGMAERLRTTEARELETARALAHSQYRQHQFLSALAHELRNPLAPLRNGLHILRLRAGQDERLMPTVTMMERQLNELARAIDHLLDEYGDQPRK